MREPYEVPATWVFEVKMEAGVLYTSPGSGTGTVTGSGEGLEGWD